MRNKGKERLVFLPAQLQKPLLRFCKARGLHSGPVFVTRSGAPLDRSNIWSQMQALCEEAGVARRQSKTRGRRTPRVQFWYVFS